MSDVIEELADEAEGRIDRGHVERRVADWGQRVLDIYDRVSDWLPPGFSTSRERRLPMHEKMMVRYGVAEIELPVLEIHKSGEWFGKLVPRGLWIIGANGRLDLFVPNGHFLVVDRSENFASPRWEIAPSSDRRRGRELTEVTFLQAIGR